MPSFLQVNPFCGFSTRLGHSLTVFMSQNVLFAYNLKVIRLFNVFVIGYSYNTAEMHNIYIISNSSKYWDNMVSGRKIQYTSSFGLSLEERICEVLRGSPRPLTAAEVSREVPYNYTLTRGRLFKLAEQGVLRIAFKSGQLTYFILNDSEVKNKESEEIDDRRR